ncbi:acetyltransferase [Mucilaginibacter sp. R11]|uniref:Acetyltransferase n=2 Tax=Mucilaginibacter agri TaxID=2695265 RepID=A0A965ZGH1_9SPHI|nr:acetyltransferase [Mucilaginibacter agri]
MHIIGAGGHAKVVLEILEQSDPILTIWDDNTEAYLVHHKVKGNINHFKETGSDKVIVAIGDNNLRKKIVGELDFPPAITAIHASSSISLSAHIGKGTVVMSNVSVNANALIGNNVIINTSASVDHDCNISDFVHIAPQVGVAGNVTVGEGTHIGIGACIIQGISIGKWATIGAGSVIIRDVPDYAVVVGNPGRIIKYKKPIEEIYD